MLLKHFDSPRYTWPLAKVVQVFKDNKGVIRSVEVLCDGGNYLRSVNQIVHLELECEDRTICFPEEEEEGESVSDGLSHQLFPQVSVEEEEERAVDEQLTRSEVTPDIRGRQPTTPSRALRRAAAQSQTKWRELIEEGSL